MPKETNVVKFKKRKNINIGVIIFLIISIYMAVNVYLYLTKSKISIYEVKEESLAKDTRVTGVIIREEAIVSTNKSGYVNYYQREGARVTKNTTIYSIDESKAIYEKLSDTDSSYSLTTKDTNEIKRAILKYKKESTDSSFQNVYTFKDDITSTIQELVGMNLLDNMQDIISNTGITSSFEVNKTSRAGVISYHTDSLDNLSEKEVTAETFDMEKYTKTNLRTVDLAEKNQVVYKLITSENWSIVAPVSKEIYEELKEKETLTFTITEDDLPVKAPYEMKQDGDDYFIAIHMNQYMIHYINERFLEIDIQISMESGYKIPLSAITEKEFFMVPTEYLTLGGDSEQQGIVVESYDSTNGEAKYTFTPVTIYFQDDTYSYIDLDVVEHGTFIYNSTTKDRFQVSMVGKLEGVFNVNKGYAVFRKIERLYENDAYCIVKKGTENGISVYDHIALDASNAVESSLIY